MKHYANRRTSMVRRIIILLIITIMNAMCGIISGFGSEPGKGATHKTRPVERIILHTDRKVYIAGENLFYSMQLLTLNRSENYPESKIAYLAIRNSNNKVVIKTISKITNGCSGGSIYLPDTLGTGLYQITSYTNLMRNSDEMFYFRKTIYIANRFDKKLNDFKNANDFQNVGGMQDSIQLPSFGKTDYRFEFSDSTPFRSSKHGNSRIKISTDKRQYNHREKIQADFEVTSPDNDSLIHFSLSVAESASLTPLFLSDSYSPNGPGLSNLDTNNNEPFLQPPNNFVNNVSTIDSIKYFPEYNGYILKGKVIDINKNVHIPNIYVLLSTPDTILNFDYAITDASGQFYFYINDYYEGKKLILSIYNKTGKISNYKIEVEDKFGLHQPFLSANKKMNPRLKDYILKSQEKVWIQKVYETNQIIIEQSHVKSSIIPVIYSSPQYIIYPDDYTEFQDMVEMSKNIIPGLRIRKENDSYSINMLGMENDYNTNSSPAIFLDGVLIDDVSRIVYLGSEKISKIEMVKSAWYFGDIEFHGILSIFSKKNEIDKIQLPSTSHIINIGNYAKNNRLIFPDYSTIDTINKEVPDFRQLLYWNPDMGFKHNDKKKIEFYSSDISGKYLIKAFGITSNGNIIESVCEIIVGSN
jgi:hypothetical protein